MAVAVAALMALRARGARGARVVGVGGAVAAAVAAVARAGALLGLRRLAVRTFIARFSEPPAQNDILFDLGPIHRENEVTLVPVLVAPCRAPRICMANLPRF